MCAFTVTSTSMALLFSSNVPWKGSSFNWTKSPYQKSKRIINSSINIYITLYPSNLVTYWLITQRKRVWHWTRSKISSQLLATCFNTVLSIFIRCKRFLSLWSYSKTYGINQRHRMTDVYDAWKWISIYVSEYIFLALSDNTVHHVKQKILGSDQGWNCLQGRRYTM